MIEASLNWRIGVPASFARRRLTALQADLQQVGAEIGQAAAFVISAALQTLKQRLADRDIDTPRASHRKAFGHDSTGGWRYWQLTSSPA